MTTISVSKKGLAAAAILAGIGLSAATASAHVGIAEEEHVAGEYTLLTFGVPHGCDGLATTSVRIGIPDEIPRVTPTVNPGWTVDVVTEELDEPVEDGHGAMLTERVSEIVYTADEPLEDGLRDTFVLSLKAPDLPGETLYFPTLQMCGDVEQPWIELPSGDTAAEDLDEPAPAIRIVASDDPGPETDETAGRTPASTDGSGSGDTDSDGSGGSGTLAAIALATGLLGTGLGGAALARSRRTI